MVDHKLEEVKIVLINEASSQKSVPKSNSSWAGVHHPQGHINAYKLQGWKVRIAQLQPKLEI